MDPVRRSLYVCVSGLVESRGKKPADERDTPEGTEPAFRSADGDQNQLTAFSRVSPRGLASLAK